MAAHGALSRLNSEVRRLQERQSQAVEMVQQATGSLLRGDSASRRKNSEQQAVKRMSRAQRWHSATSDGSSTSIGAADLAALRDTSEEEIGPWRLHPESTHTHCWELLQLVALVFTATVTPYEVSLADDEVAVDALFWVNRAVDLLFLGDVVVRSCMLVFFDAQEGVWVTDRRRIFSRYARGGLLLDAIPVVPWGVIGLLDESVASLQALRVLRVLRLAKLVKLVRARSALEYLLAHSMLPRSALVLLKMSMAVVIIVHWLACGYLLVARLQSNSYSWVDAYGLGGASNADVYVAALYWSVTTLTTIGYGDITSVTDAERLFACVAMLGGASWYAYLVGNICSLLSNLDADNAAFVRAMDEVNEFVTETELEPLLQERVREYFAHVLARRSADKHTELLAQMSPELRGVVATHINGEWVCRVPFFRSAGVQLVAALSLEMRNVTFTPRETIVRPGDPADSLIIIEKGIVMCRNRIQGSATFIGEEMILRNAKRHYTATAVMYVDARLLSRDALFRVLQRFPVTAKEIRRSAIRMCFRREVLTIAKEWAYQQELAVGGGDGGGSSRSVAAVAPDPDAGAVKAVVRSLVDRVVASQTPAHERRRLTFAVPGDEEKLDDQHTDDFVREGWLVKRGLQHKGWRRRWVVLHPDPAAPVMDYFRDPQASQCQGSVDLSRLLSVRIVATPQHPQLEIETPSSVYVFRSGDAAELDRWRASLERFVDRKPAAAGLSQKVLVSPRSAPLPAIAASAASAAGPAAGPAAASVDAARLERLESTVGALVHENGRLRAAVLDLRRELQGKDATTQRRLGALEERVTDGEVRLETWSEELAVDQTRWAQQLESLLSLSSPGGKKRGR